MHKPSTANHCPAAFFKSLLCVGALSASASSLALETNGYLRTGALFNQAGAQGACFKLPGASSKYRLGNECEQYAEIMLTQKLLSLDDSSVVAVQGMPALLNPYDREWTFNGESGGRIRMAQMFVDWRNVAALNGGNFWAGRRYYKRKNIGISDFVYWNQSATGFGFDEVRIGDLRYSYVYSRKDSVFQKDAVTRQDFNVAGFRTNKDGEVEIGVNLFKKPSGTENAHSGWSLGVQHNQKIGDTGRNKLAFQYGQGPGIGLGLTGSVTADASSRSYRLIDGLEWQLLPRFGVQLEALYQRNQGQPQRGEDWLSLGGRTTYGVSEQIKLISELGYDRIQSREGIRYLNKVTLATAWSPKGPGFALRPEFRLFYTYANWSKAAQLAANDSAPGSALSDTGTFGSDLHGSIAGVQLEYGW